MKVIIQFNKKSPIKGVEFSSIGAGISIESDIGDNKGDEDIRAIARHLYGISKGIVETALADNSNGNHNSNGHRGGNGETGNGSPKGNGGSSNGNGTQASEKQLNFLISLCQKRFKGGVSEFEDKLKEDGIESISHLTKRAASQFIESFKKNGNGR